MTKKITAKSKSKISTPSRKITKETKFDKIMEINPDAGMILFEHGLHCVGCGMASMETLEQGCLAHGMEKKEIKELIDRLNSKTIKEIKMIEKPKIPERPNLELRKRSTQRVYPEKSSAKIFTEGKKPSLIQKIRRRLR